MAIDVAFCIVIGVIEGYVFKRVFENQTKNPIGKKEISQNSAYCLQAGKQ